METTPRHDALVFKPRPALASRRLLLAPRRAFTLVELLVVITIIGILAALITVAAAGALNRARQAEIKTELDQIGMAFESYKDSNGSYPPNCQTDNSSQIDSNQVLTDLRRHLKQAFPRHQEPEELLRRLAGDSSLSNTLPGGMTAGEALVFWLSGFSPDPKYPISGEGGPSYQIDNLPAGQTPQQADPIANRNWVMPLEVARLVPRDPNNDHFDESTDRFVVYGVTVNGENQTRRINFWQYAPRQSQQPYLYFDVSRHPAVVNQGGTFLATFDPPAATGATGLGPGGVGLHVHAIKTANPTYTEGATSEPPVLFANPEKFQILHAGTDDAWGVEAFELMSAHGVSSVGEFLLYPTGPFTGEVADTIVNFSSSTLEASQP